jgi:regulator of protease activity HflC (stomatin/prohibitin superfamily)
MVRETYVKPMSGWLALIVLVVVLAALAGVISSRLAPSSTGLTVLATVIIAVLGLRGFIAVQPNSSRVLLLFGKYVGTVKDSGFFWVNPFYLRKRVSLRIRNFETGSITTPEKRDWQTGKFQAKTRTIGKPSKVNDRDGNPIEISAVVVWRVVDTAEALFEVDDYEDFVAVQSEAALRNLASRHPYDSEDHQVSLRGSTDVICANLREDIQERLGTAGVEVVEARISHLAYAAEIAAAMLRRQQAQAVVAARAKIVEGAVGMVESALERLRQHAIIELDDERRAAMVSNLLVVLCSDRDPQPVVNTGTLYQ